MNYVIISSLILRDVMFVSSFYTLLVKMMVAFLDFLQLEDNIIICVAAT